MIHKIICYFFGHRFEEIERFESTAPKQIMKQCTRCGAYWKVNIY